MPEIDPTYINLAIMVSGIMVQAAGCLYQRWTLRKIERLHREIMALHVTTPVTGLPNGKVHEMAGGSGSHDLSV